MNSEYDLEAILNDYPKSLEEGLDGDLDKTIEVFYAAIEEVDLSQPTLSLLEKAIFDDDVADGLLDTLMSTAFDEEAHAKMVMTLLRKMATSGLVKGYSQEQYDTLIEMERANLGLNHNATSLPSYN